ALPFYAGNKFYLFYKKVYTDVRMVAAPPSSVGKFGGEAKIKNGKNGDAPFNEVRRRAKMPELTPQLLIRLPGICTRSLRVRLELLALSCRTSHKLS
ncbi:S46 family peptidase, partial [Bacteroides cellulosilyticus]